MMKYDGHDITNAHLSWYQTKQSDFALKAYEKAILEGKLYGDLLCLRIISDALKIKVLNSPKIIGGEN